MKRANKVLTVLLVLAMILTPILKPEFSVLAEEGDPAITEEETPEAEESKVLDPEIEAPETEDPEIEEPETETPEAEGEFIPDEEVEVIPEDEVTPEEEASDPEASDEEDIPDQVTPEEETPDPETPGEEEIPEEETPKETEDTVTPEETSEGIHFAVEEMTEADLEALPLSALLGYLRDGDENVFTFPEGADTLWFRIIDGNGNVVYNESYGVGSDAVLNLRQYFVTPGYTLELTAGTGEREQPGNTVYQVEMGSAGYQTDPVSLNDHEKVYATYSLNGLDPVVKWKEIFENLYDRDTGAKVEIPPDSVVMWRRWFDDDENPDPENYVRVNPEDEVDLAQEFSLELLVGEGNQWTVDSTELIVEIIPVYPHNRTYHLARETGAGWIKLAPQDVASVDEYWFEEPYLGCEGDGLTFVAGDIKDGDTYYVGIDIPESDWNSPYWDITVYDMNDALASDDLSKQIDVTSQIVNQPMDTPGAGYPCTYRSRRENVFAVVFTSKDTGEIIGVESVRYGISTEDYKISGTLLTEDGEQVGETLDILDSFSNGSFVPIWRVPYSDWTSRKYYLKLNIQSSLENPIVGIVEGYCKSWDEAYAKLEAEGDLLPALKEGYTTEALKGEGTDFVILCNNHQVRKFHVSIRISVDLVFTGMLYDAQGQEALQDPLTFQPASYLRHGVIKPGYSPDDTFFFRLTLNEGYDGSVIQRIVVGYYNEFDDPHEVAEREDVMPQLLGTDGTSAGYPIHYSSSEYYFTLLYQDGSVEDISFDLEEIDPELSLHGLIQDGRSLTSYEVESEYQESVSDTQYQYNYRTIFVYDEDADLSRLTLDYSVYPEGSQLTADGVVVDRSTTIDFSKGPVHFTVTYEGWARTNYTVSVVKRSAQPQLFVYPSDTPATDPETGVVPEEDYVREIFLDENHEYRHDILIANMGDAPLTGIKVSLTGSDGDSSNMCCTIDDYWNVDGATLAPFTQPEDYPESLPNIAKISLIPDQNGGPINGTLTISADGVEPVKIKLIGFARNPRILNEGSLPSGVKYVPYSTIIDTNCQYDWIQTTFAVSGLPEGLEWRERTGEIYGIPQAAGEYTVTITANFTATSGSGYQFNPCTVSLTLTIEDNTDENVYTATDSGYELEQPIGTEVSPYHFVLTEFQDELFVSRGELSELIDVWLNGQKLVRDAEYGAESGSSRITVWKQTLENKADKSGGKNTLAAEFREGGNEDNPLHRTAQNFYVKMEESQPTPPVTTDPKPEPEPEPEPDPEPEPNPDPQVPTQGPPTPTVGPHPTTPAVPTSGPRPTTPAVPTEEPYPTTPPVPTSVPQPTATPVPTSVPRPTKPAVPTTAPRPTTPAVPTAAPRPTSPGVPTAVPRPTATAVPTNAPQPTAAPKPSEVPNPSKIPEPTKQPNPTRAPQASETPGPSGEPVPSRTPGPGENPSASGTPAPAVSGTPLPTATPTEVNYVNLAASLTDEDGNPLVTRNLEMHSDPVKSTTDVNGLAGFGRVEYGTHTVYLKDENGNLGPSTTFTLEPGDGFSMEAGKITGKRGSAMTISLTFADGKLILNGVEEGIKSKPAPQTGDDSMPGVWMLLMVVSLGAAGLAFRRKLSK